MISIQEFLKISKESFLEKEVFSVSFYKADLASIRFGESSGFDVFADPRIKMDADQETEFNGYEKPSYLIGLIEDEVKDVIFDGEDFIFSFSSGKLLLLKRQGTNDFDTGMIWGVDESLIEF